LLQAAAIQEALLPSEAILDTVKENCPVDLSALYEASVGLGGDIWGIDLIGEQRVMIFNADFVGHGLGAALNTVRLHSFINRSPEKPDTPATVLTQLNRFLCGVLPIGQFATMFCAIMDFKAHTLEYASAAAPPSLLRSAQGEPFKIIDEPGFPLGVTRDATYDNCTARFAPGAMLLLFSDALIETPSPPDSAFTIESLAEFVASLPPISDPQVLRNRVLTEFFSRITEKPDDDLTLIATHHMVWES
jgi:sigma-B regulation protein RsbU (phosphoserine phosphatase)